MTTLFSRYIQCLGTMSSIRVSLFRWALLRFISAAQGACLGCTCSESTSKNWKALALSILPRPVCTTRTRRKVASRLPCPENQGALNLNVFLAAVTFLGQVVYGHSYPWKNLLQRCLTHHLVAGLRHMIFTSYSFQFDSPPAIRQHCARRCCQNSKQLSEMFVSVADRRWAGRDEGISRLAKKIVLDCPRTLVESLLLPRTTAWPNVDSS